MVVIPVGNFDFVVLFDSVQLMNEERHLRFPFIHDLIYRRFILPVQHFLLNQTVEEHSKYLRDANNEHLYGVCT